MRSFLLRSRLVWRGRAITAIMLAALGATASGAGTLGTLGTLRTLGTLGTGAGTAPAAGDRPSPATVAPPGHRLHDAVVTSPRDGVIHVQSPIQVCVAPSDTSVAIGDALVLRLTADGPPADLQGYSVRMTYSPGALGPASLNSPGTVLDAVPNFFYSYTAAPDTLGFDAGVLGTTTAGPGTLATYSFVAQSAGISTFHLTLALLRNSLNDPLPVVLCDGVVRVQSGTAASSRTWGAIKALYAQPR